MIKEELHLIKTADEETIALWKVTNTLSNKNQHIFLTHGTFSDKRICLGIAKYFAELDYTCWIMEWRNHGASPRTDKAFNFETIGLLDVQAAMYHLRDKVGIKKISCITHSGGGICLTMFLVKNPSFREIMHRISFFGCQAFGAASSRLNYWQIVGSKYMTRLLGKMPATKNGRPHDETYYTMKQWYDWNLNKQFKGADDFDYLPNMPSIRTPILSICAKGDPFVAPKEGCAAFLAAFKNPVNQLVYCSKAAGFLEDYDHSRIMLSRNAAKELWPVVQEWIEQIIQK